MLVLITHGVPSAPQFSPCDLKTDLDARNIEVVVGGIGPEFDPSLVGCVASSEVKSSRKLIPFSLLRMT